MQKASALHQSLGESLRRESKAAIHRQSEQAYENLPKEGITKRQVDIFHEVSEDLASRLEKVFEVKVYLGISASSFHGTHNGMAKDPKDRTANHQTISVSISKTDNNSAPNEENL